VICGLLGAWYPFHAEHYSHLELQWVMFVPLAIVAALRMLAAPGWKTGFQLGAAVAAPWLASMYVGVMLMSFLAPFTAIVWVAWRVRPSWRLVSAMGAVAAIVLPAVVGLGIPYMKSREARGERGPGEVGVFSAQPRDYAAINGRMLSYSWRSRVRNRVERELFPGTSTLALAAAGIVPPLTGAAAATAVAGALTFDWSLGFNGLTYDDLYDHSVVHRGMRVPARFSVVVGAALALLGAFGARRVLRLGRSANAQNAICAALALLVIFDLRFDAGLQPYFRSVPAIYARVTPDMVLAEFPADHEIDYMYFSTRHQAHLLTGYSGFMPIDRELSAALNAFPSPEGLEALRRRGATHVTYNCRFERRERSCEAMAEALDASPSLALVASERWQAVDVRLYRFRYLDRFSARPYVRVDEVDDLLHRAARQEDAFHADGLQLGDIHVGNDAANHDQHVVESLLFQQLHHARAGVHVRAGQDREPDHVGIFLKRGADDLFGSLAEAGVDHFHPGVAQRAGDDFGAPIVAVEAGLGDNDSDLLHRRKTVSRRAKVIPHD
jgi:hypothetical protein